MAQLRPSRRLPGPSVAAGLAVCLLLAAGAQAAIVVRSDSTLHVQVTAPPVTFDEGSGATRSRFVSVSVSANGTSFNVDATSRVGADVSTKDVVRLVNAAEGARTVTLRGDQVAHANVLIYTWTAREGGTTRGTLDMRSASPSVSVTVPAGSYLELDIRLKLAKDVDPAASGFASNVWAVVP